MSSFGVITMTGSAIAVNAIYQIRHDRDPYPVVFIGGLVMGSFVLIGTGYPELGTALAAVYLLSVLVSRGEDTFSLAGDLTTGVSQNRKNHAR